MTNLVYAVFLCDHTTDYEAYSFTTDEYGIFNVRTQLIWVHAVYTLKGGQTQTSLPISLTRRDKKKMPLTLPRRGIEPRVVGFKFSNKILKVFFLNPCNP